MPKMYDYSPQPDITAYELALIVPLIASPKGPYRTEREIANHPELARHFTEQDNDLPPGPR
jgi:hypothetical protein